MESVAELAMRPTSVCCRRRPSKAGSYRHGFTLLELLVVLALVAMVTGLTLPAVSRWLDNARERAWHQALRSRLESLPLRAFHAGAPLVLDAEALRGMVEDMPADAAIELSAPLRYAASGAAEAAQVRLREANGKVTEWQIEGVTGNVLP